MAKQQRAITIGAFPSECDLELIENILVGPHILTRAIKPLNQKFSYPLRVCGQQAKAPVEATAAWQPSAWVREAKRTTPGLWPGLLQFDARPGRPLRCCP